MKVHDPHDEDEFDEDWLLYDHFSKSSEGVWIVAIIAAFAFLVILSALGLFLRPANAHSWYSAYCCNDQDCRPISGIKNGEPWSEIADMGDYYLWKSSQTAATYEIPKSDERILPSQDGFYHGCEVSGDQMTDYYARCLYVPVMF